MKKAGFTGYFTNHSRATTATCLFDASIDEQPIMSRTGHSSTEGELFVHSIYTQTADFKHIWSVQRDIQLFLSKIYPLIFCTLI